MRKNAASAIAMGGVFAALAMVIMCLGGMIPVATYVCPMLCMLILNMILQRCGKRIAWAWYACVALLSLLIGPDKEAAGVFLFLGYYPIVKRSLEKSKLGFLWKLMLFNGSVALLYLVLYYLMGLDEIAVEYAELGIWGLALALLMGNVTFFLTDRVLGRLTPKR